MPLRRRPNILFILGDDWGWGDLGCFGHSRLRTPHLDRLAEQGTIYTQFYVAAPVCSPSRASFLTGLFPGECGFHHICDSAEVCDRYGVPHFLDPTLPTVSNTFHRDGYRTAHFGKWHLGSTPDAPDPGGYGFDRHISINSAPDDLRTEFYGGGPEVTRPENDVIFRPHSTRMIVDHAIDFLREDDAPFFMQLWLLDPHATLNPSGDVMAEYQELSPHSGGYHGVNTVYYSVISEADRQLGRLFDALDASGRADDTIVLFTGDNGPEDLYVPNASHSAAGSPGPFRGRKRSLYEGGVRMPLIARWPGHIPAGGVDNDSVLSSVDLFATCCAAAGVPATETDGENVLPALCGENQPRAKNLYWEFRFGNGSHPIHLSPMVAVRAGRWKLLCNPDGSRLELYDIPADPMEMTNLAERNPEVARRLRDEVLTWSSTLPDGPRDPNAGSNFYPWPTGGDHAADPAFALRPDWDRSPTT
jgi:N-acetylgalactosamine-6-sulfatase